MDIIDRILRVILAVIYLYNSWNCFCTNMKTTQYLVTKDYRLNTIKLVQKLCHRVIAWRIAESLMFLFFAIRILHPVLQFDNSISKYYAFYGFFPFVLRFWWTHIVYIGTRHRGEWFSPIDLICGGVPALVLTIFILYILPRWA